MLEYIKKIKKERAIYKAKKDKKNNEKKSDNFLKTLVWAVVLTVVVRSVLFEIFFIPSGSMIPNLLVGDHINVSKASYGYSRYSFPLSLPLFKGRISGQQPERGDISVFRNPKKTKVDYIKRLIGMPGDKIQVIQGRLHINGQVVEREFVSDYYEVNINQKHRFNDKIYYKLDNDKLTILKNKDLMLNDKLLKFADDYVITYVNDEYTCLKICGVAKYKKYKETLPNGRWYYVIEHSDEEPYDNTVEYIVPEDSYFFLGDNRDNSQDSRFENELGFVHKDYLIGRANLGIYYYSSGSRIWELWRWNRSFRSSRFFKKIVADKVENIGEVEVEKLAEKQEKKSLKKNSGACQLDEYFECEDEKKKV